ncbi:MAG: DUF3578 domain-containing protein [Burkholderiales bacterium]|nr:DUF3578 domain-containing protein [Burkholderiales bacterium]
MARYCGEVIVGPILEAAALWRDRALLGQGSVFIKERALWTLDALAALDEFYVQRPDEGEGGFHEKLKAQLEPAGSTAIQLAAELMWIMYLCPRKISSAKKRQTIRTIWGWSGEIFPADSPLLAEEVLSGVGSAGPGFNQNQWRELVFAIGLVTQFKKLSADEQQNLLADAWRFDAWVSALPDAESRQFRHMVLFLLFPEVFERFFGQTDRRAVATHFSARDKREVARLTNLELDRELWEIRKTVERQEGRSDLDFYLPPLRDRWKSESVAEVTSTVTRDHILSALARIDAEQVPADARSTSYDLLHEGRRYPPKYVLSLAVAAATGEPLDRAAFSGGEDTICFRVLRDRGFEIVPKLAEADIEGQLKSFVKQALEATDLRTQSYANEYRAFRVKVGFGQGNVARIPWMAWLGNEERVSNGIYPVLLLFREEGVVLLCYGVSETAEPLRNWKELPGKKSVRDWFRENMGSDPARYGGSFVAWGSKVDAIDFPRLHRELDQLLDQYSANLALGPQVDDQIEVADDLPRRLDLREAADAFADALLSCGVNFGESHALTASAFLASLMTKPLVILTGLSGSGKSQIAVRLGEWLGVPERLMVVPVRPDWTGADALFGFEDGLKPSKDGLPAWHVPVTLGFMLRAQRDPQHPYLLVLDEMNLAHVERYFADVLSGMESGQPCIPDLRYDKQDGSWRPVTRDARVCFPRNLWIVGTVNVDETTYMFSPKVLDRANTLEFRVRTSDLTLSPKKPTACSAGDKELIRGLCTIAGDDNWHVARPATEQTEVVKALHALHALLSGFNLEFGHRVFYEAVRFSAMAEQSGISGLAAILDLIVLQKILPRMHGSRRRIEGPLIALRAFCQDLSGPPPPVPSGVTRSIALPRSYAKLDRMLAALRANQFVSFSE